MYCGYVLNLKSGTDLNGKTSMFTTKTSQRLAHVGCRHYSCMTTIVNTKLLLTIFSLFSIHSRYVSHGGMFTLDWQPRVWLDKSNGLSLCTLACPRVSCVCVCIICMKTVFAYLLLQCKNNFFFHLLSLESGVLIFYLVDPCHFKLKKKCCSFVFFPI